MRARGRNRGLCTCFRLHYLNWSGNTVWSLHGAPCTLIFRTNVRAHRPSSSEHPPTPALQTVLFSLLSPRLLFSGFWTILRELETFRRLCDRSYYRLARSRDPRLLFPARQHFCARLFCGERERYTPPVSRRERAPGKFTVPHELTKNYSRKLFKLSIK